MIKKKKAKKSEAAKKSAKKIRGKKGKKIENLSAEEVRENISELVKADADEIATAVIGAAKGGQFAQAKYLFELAHVYPSVNDGSEATKEEDSLAQTLLNRLNIPDTPVVGEEEDVVVIPAKKAEPERTQSESEEQPEEVPVG